MAGQLIVVLVILFLLLVLMSHRQRRSMRNILRSTFSHYLYNKKTKQLSLFTNEQNSPDRSFPLKTINQYQIILNQETIFSFNRDDNLIFSQCIIDQLKRKFDHESRFKMVDNRIRNVYLVITVNNKKNYTICLYLRKGHRRYTKKHFSEVLEELITWCFLTLLSSDDINDISLPKSSTIIEKDTTSSSLPSQVAKQNNIKKKNLEKSNDGYLIDQLDKLITLKLEGHLTEEEFNLAKIKLLKELTQN